MMEKPGPETIHYLLCSPNFQDIVIIHPADIDSCTITSNYKIPSLNEIRNSYFRYHRQLHRQQLHKYNEHSYI